MIFFWLIPAILILVVLMVILYFAIMKRPVRSGDTFKSTPPPPGRESRE